MDTNTYIYCPDGMIYAAVVSHLFERGLFHEETDIQPSIGSNYVEVGEASFKLMSKNEYLKKTK